MSEYIIVAIVACGGLYLLISTLAKLGRTRWRERSELEKVKFNDHVYLEYENGDTAKLWIPGYKSLETMVKSLSMTNKIVKASCHSTSIDAPAYFASLLKDHYRCDSEYANVGLTRANCFNFEFKWVC